MEIILIGFRRQGHQPWDGGGSPIVCHGQSAAGRRCKPPFSSASDL